MSTQLQVALRNTSAAALAVRHRASDLLALTSPASAEIRELSAAGVPYATVAELYPLDVTEHLPLIFERLRIEPGVKTRLIDGTLSGALTLFSFGANTKEFRLVERAARRYANQHFPERGLDRGAAMWWAYLLTCITEQDRWPRYGSPGRTRGQLKAATTDVLSIIDMLLSTPTAR